MTKYIITIIAVGAILAMGLRIDRQSRSVPSRRPVIGPPAVIHAPGRVEGASQEINLRPQLAGRVDVLPIAEGDYVSVGDVLLGLDDRQYRHEAALARAQLQLAEAKFKRLVNGTRKPARREAESLLKAKSAELQRAQLQWTRVKQLRAENAVTQQEADDQRMEVTALDAAVDAARARFELLNAPARDDEILMAKATIAAARAKLESAELRVSRARLTAPMTGRVLLVNTALGELTGPDAAEPAMVLADTARLRVRAFVDELDAPRVRIGMPATITADGIHGAALRGTVTRLSPRMNRKQLRTDAPDERFDTKTREIWIDLDLEHEYTDTLIIGLRVDVAIYAERTRTSVLHAARSVE